MRFLAENYGPGGVHKILAERAAALWP